MQRIHAAIASHQSAESLFQALAAEFARQFHYDRFSINIYERDTNTIRYFGTPVGITPLEFTDIRPLEKASIVQLAVTSGRPVFIYDLSRTPHLETATWLYRAGLRCTMVFPMTVRNRVTGSIHFSFRKVPPHVHELRELLNELTVPIAIGVDNMLSYTTLTEEAEERNLRSHHPTVDADSVGMDGRNVFHYVSDTMSRVMADVELAAGTDASILLTGETGTGKGHLAGIVHQKSRRCGGPFVTVNCAALAPTLIESELFGHVRGAFTGAFSGRKGRFEAAHGGTLFLDEIGDFPLTVQAKLLQVLQDRTFEPVGGTAPVSVDFRLLAASNHDLGLRIREKTFRSDLFYRLNTIHLHIPPLRERQEDIPVLVAFFTEKHAKQLRKPPVRYTAPALDLLCRYTWPGNVRELENVVERLTILRSGELISDQDLSRFLYVDPGGPSPVIATREAMERRHIEEALSRCGGRVGGPGGAAQLLGMHRTTLQYRMKKLGISRHRPVRAGDG